LIQKRDYAAAEPLLRKVVGDDPANYEAWFDLGFAGDGLGKMDESIAAYRKSVGAKPDVFESNLESGTATRQEWANRMPNNFCARPPNSSRQATSRKARRGRGSLWRMCWKRQKPDEALAAYRQAYGVAAEGS